MSAHTPGPWHVTPDSFVMTTSRPSLGIARVITHVRGFDANARLIAAAPDLLEALREIDGEAVCPAAEYVPALPKIWEIARRAIAKAEGP